MNVFDKLGLELLEPTPEEVDYMKFDLGGAYAKTFSRPPWNESYSLTMEDEQGKPSAPKHFVDCAAAGADIFVAKRRSDIVAFSIGIRLTAELAERYGLTDFGIVPGQSYYNLDSGVVDPRFEGNGIATAMIVLREQRARNYGRKFIYCRTRVDHAALIRCYRDKRGYDILGTHQASTGGIASERIYFGAELAKLSSG